MIGFQQEQSVLESRHPGSVLKVLTRVTSCSKGGLRAAIKGSDTLTLPSYQLMLWGMQQVHLE